MEIYLDHASTTKVHPLVIKAMNDGYADYYANPSSVHTAGYQAYQRINEARNSLLRILQAGKEYELVFTSGGTEANNTIIAGSFAKSAASRNTWLCSSIEHPSVLEPYEQIKRKGAQVISIPCGSDGQVRLADLEQAIGPGTEMISLMHVNNETGIIQPIQQAVKLIRHRYPHIAIHVDGVQAFGKIEYSLKTLGVDYYTISAHKIGGPRGMGAIVCKKTKKPAPLIWGGGQEKNVRSGTENTPGIIGFEMAAALRSQNLAEHSRKVREIRKKLVQQIHDQVKDVRIIEAVDEAKQVPGILLITVDGTQSEVILRMLADDQIYVSAGAACSSKKTDSSHVLRAMHLKPSMIQGALRISFDDSLSNDQIDRLTQRMAVHAVQMRKMMKR